MIFKFKKPDPEFTRKWIEQYEADQARRHQRPPDDVLARVLGWVREHGVVHSEEVDYTVNSYDFTGDEFHSVLDWLEHLADENDIFVEDVVDSMFPEERASFVWGDLKFIYYSMSGQGTVWTIARHDYNPDVMPFDGERCHVIPVLATS